MVAIPLARNPEYQLPMFGSIKLVDPIALLIAKEFCLAFRHMHTCG